MIKIELLYYSEGWQRIFRVDNSFIVWGGALGIALILRAPFAVALCGAALLHLALDFPLHNDDARAHFWPLTNWKFYSPVSYWDPAFYGHIVAPIEIVLSLLVCVWLWVRYTGRFMRALIVGLGALQAMPAIIFGLMFAGT